MLRFFNMLLIFLAACDVNESLESPKLEFQFCNSKMSFLSSVFNRSENCFKIDTKHKTIQFVDDHVISYSISSESGLLQILIVNEDFVVAIPQTTETSLRSQTLFESGFQIKIIPEASGEKLKLVSTPVSLDIRDSQIGSCSTSVIAGYSRSRGLYEVTKEDWVGPNVCSWITYQLASGQSEGLRSF
jgi:hypothetical protein